MAIKWNDGTESHEGCVIGNPFTRTDRVMSDIYADTSHVWVFNPSEKSVGTIQVSSAFELDSNVGKWDADIETGEFAQEYQDYLEKQKVLSAEKEKARQIEVDKRKEESTKDALLSPRKGLVCKVVKGRKVPKGTVGEIFWVGDKGYGLTVGFKESNGTGHFTAASNVICTGFGLDFGQDPVGMSWVGLDQKIRSAEEFARNKSRLPKVGDKVREKKNPANVGDVFWVKDQRIGFKNNNASDPTWADMEEVQYLLQSSKTWEDYVLVAPVIPNFQAPQKPVAPSSSFASTNTQPPTQKVPETVVNPLSSFPAPLCDIRQISQRQDGKWVALDGDGVLITVLPESSALELGSLLV